jgi:light-regulated signal transduction histidine kinase (bacteriophytochrome)
MSLLIDDLLQYARATPRGEDLEPVDLAAAVRETLSQLDVLIDQNGVKVNVEPLPTVRAVRSLLQPLFSNLIGNAVKYRGQEPPVIRIGARRDGEKWEVWVADNGIGIDPQHSDRIFRLFERLHTRKQYLGTGIGLAICKRIVEIHGGRIWVESAPGQGATFRFTLPA